MYGDVGLGIDIFPPSRSRIARLPDSEERSLTAPRRRKTASMEDDIHAKTLVQMQSSKAMTGLLLAETGGSMIEVDRLSGSRLKEGKHIEPGAVTPLAGPISVSSRMPSRVRSGHASAKSVDQGLARHGTLLTASPATPRRRAEQLKVLLGDSSAKIQSGAIVSSQQHTKFKSKNNSRDSPDAVTFEQGRSNMRVALDIDLENNVAVEGGYMSGVLLIRVRPKKKGELLKLGASKIRVAGFEVAPKNGDRDIFYQTAAPLLDISNGFDDLFNNGVDEDGFGSVGEGEYSVRFSLKIPLVSTGGKPRGVLNGCSGAAIKYIIIASMRVVDPVTGKRSIAHFYRDCEIWPYIDPSTALAPTPDPILARAAKKVFMGGDGTVALTASVHRHTWIAGQPVHVRVRIVNDTKKTVRSVSLALVRTTTLFRPCVTRTAGVGDELDEGETETSERKVAETVLVAGQKGAKGRASAKGWWTAVGKGESMNVTHSIVVPSDALTISRARLVEVDYAVRVGLGVSSIAGNSEAVHVTLPIRIVNVVSLDPPPCGPISSTPASSVIELDTPKPETSRMRSASSAGGGGRYSSRSSSESGMEHLETHDYYYEGEVPREFPTAHTMHDLGNVEDADDLDGVLGNIPGSTSLLDESDITLDSGYSEGECYFEDQVYGKMQGNENEVGGGYEGGEDEDVGSDEELERMVGCASARIDGGVFQQVDWQTPRQPAFPDGYLVDSQPPRAHYRTSHAKLSTEDERLSGYRSDGPRAVHGPRKMKSRYERQGAIPHHPIPVRQAIQQEHGRISTVPVSNVLTASRTVLQVTNPSERVFGESLGSMYSATYSAPPSLHASPSRRMRSSPSKYPAHESQNRQRGGGGVALPRPPPPVLRSLTAPTAGVLQGSSSNSNVHYSNMPASSSRVRANTLSGTQSRTFERRGGGHEGPSSVRAKIAMLEQTTHDGETDVESGVRPEYVSSSLTTTHVPSSF